MNRLKLIPVLILVTGITCAQTPAGHLTVGKSDFIGHGNLYPFHAYLLEGESDGFYWISGSSYDQVAHPFLKEVYSDYECLYFIRYNNDGEPVSSGHINGTNQFREAFSYDGGIILFSGSYNDIEASGNIIPLDNAGSLEFLASYDRQSELKKIQSIWAPMPSVSPYSYSAMDRMDGSIYIFGSSTETSLELNGYGVIGEKWQDRFIYIIKYNRDLEVEWTYTAGFELEANGYGNITNLMAYPDAGGNVLITGSYESGQASLVMGEEVLPSWPDGLGLFAVRLDQAGNQQWVQQGTNRGFGYQSYIHDGFAMSNGDLVLVGITSTGYFQLGDLELTLEGGEGSLNQFVYRMRPDGTVAWSNQYKNMAYASAEGKKGGREEHFLDHAPYDAAQWKQKVLYLAGNYRNETFQVAGKPIPKAYAEGIYLVSIDLDSGVEKWTYAISSETPVDFPNYVAINGLDTDASGNVYLMATTSEIQEFEQIGMVNVKGTDLVLHLGLDFKGQPLWYNNAHLQNLLPGAYASDLEVLENGRVFSSLNVEISEYLVTENDALIADFNSANWLLHFTSPTALSGRVTDNTGTGVSPGIVKIYKSSPYGAFPMVDTVILNDAGGFLIPGLYPGRFTLLAEPGDAFAVSPSVPTYLGNRVTWSEAEFLFLDTDDTLSALDIQLKEKPVLGPDDGSGTMTGNVSYKDESDLKGTEAYPVKGTKVILLRKARKSTLAGEVVAIVETDDVGNYNFVNVPDGDYVLLVEIPGLPMIRTYHVTIVEGKIVDGLDFVVSEEGIDITGTADVKNNETRQFRLFPNPGDGRIFLEFPDAIHHLVSVYGADGRLVRTYEKGHVSGMQMLDLSDCPEGLYLIRISGKSADALYRYILQ